MYVHPTVCTRPVGNTGGGSSHGPQLYKALRPSGSVAFTGECRALGPLQQRQLMAAQSRVRGSLC